MELASAIHNGSRLLVTTSDPSLLNSARFHIPKCTRLGFSNSHSPIFAVTSSSLGLRHLSMACSQRVTDEDELSASDENMESCSHINDQESFFSQTLQATEQEKAIAREIYASSVRTVAFWVSTAVAFGIGIGLKDGVEKATEFFAGYLLEQSLSVDNLFVFVLVFKYFKVPLMYQNRVLSYGIAGAIVFRLSLILIGTATLQRFEAVNLLLASVLLYSAFKATPLLLTVAVIELSDIAFAVDSIPAVFGVTRDPFIVFTSNLFAILGLRSLYTLISEGMSDLEYLQPAIGIVLGFIGSKMVVDFFGYHVSTEVSLGFVAATISSGVLLSVLKKSD